MSETFAEYMARTGGTSGGGATPGTTSNKTQESTSRANIGTSFGLTGGSLTGLRTPDAIDNERNSLRLTTDVGVQTLPPEQMAVLQQQLQMAGLTPATYKPTGTLDDDTKTALLELKRTSASTGMSDMETLRTQIETRAQAAAGAFGGASSGGSVSQARTEVRTDVSEPVLTDPVTARGIVRDAMEQRLGRSPTADEYHQFRQQLSNSEAGQDVSTTTTRYGKRGQVKSTHTTRSDDTTDPSASDVADEFTRRGKLGVEANTRDAGVGYYDALQRLIGG